MSSSNPMLDGELLCQHIQASLEEAVKTAAEPLIAALVADVEKQVRKELGTLVCQLFREYDVRRMTNQLEIRVRLTDER